jgi:cytochrome c5
MKRIWSGLIVTAAAVAALTTHAAFGQQSAPSTLNANPTPQSQVASQRAAQQAALLKMQAHGEELFNARCKGCHMPPVEHAPSRGELAAQFPNVIIDALSTGKMQPMAAGLERLEP